MLTNNTQWSACNHNWCVHQENPVVVTIQIKHHQALDVEMLDGAIHPTNPPFEQLGTVLFHKV